MSGEPLPTLLQLTALDPGYRVDPHVSLDRLRSDCPVYHDDTSGSFILTRHEDIRRLLSDRSLLCDPLKAQKSAVLQRWFAGAASEEVPRSETTSILMLDDPDHARIRKPLSRALAARIAKLRPEVESIIDKALDAIDPSEPFDLVSRFCVPVSVGAIAAILGVDHERLAEFRDWSEGAVQKLNPFRTEAQTEHMERAAAALTEYFSETVKARRADPRDDLISDMVRLQADGAVFSDVELQINLRALLNGGNLTTSDLIGNAVLLLLQHPEELAKLKASPALVAAVVEETLRYEPPAYIIWRIASADTNVGGCPIRAGQVFSLFLRAANHDPDVFEEPHRFDITRFSKPHVAFGGGSHICIGAALARLEGQVALLKLFERFPDLCFANSDKTPDWRSSHYPFIRGLERLELRKEPR